MKAKSNVILFPKTVETLEAESFMAIDEQRFGVALEKINTLLTHQVFTPELRVGKLICLIRLERLEEAEQFCEQLLLDRDDEHYYEYFEYFIMILYEQGKYSEVMEIIDEEENGQIPSFVQPKFTQLYEICYQMNETKAIERINELRRAIKECNHPLQLYVMNKWQQLHIEPPAIFGAFLTNENVHPVVKTKILESLQAYKVNGHVDVEKFGERITVLPEALLQMDKQPIYVKTLATIQKVEQDNPTLYQLVKELLDQYSYVRYPFFHPESDVKYVAKALIQLGKLNLSLLPSHIDCENTNKYMKKIQDYHELYSKIMLL